MIEVKKKNDKYLVRFCGPKEEFSEYFQKISSIRNREYDFEDQAWLIPEKSYKYLESLFDDIKLDGEDKPKKISGYENVGEQMKLPPFDYQKEAIKFALDTKTAIINYPCGSGKTPIGIGVFLELIHNEIISPPGLIVVKATAKKQWSKEVEKFSDLTPRIVQSYSDSTYNIRSRIGRLEKKLEETPEDKELKKEIRELKKQEKQAFAEQFQDADLYIANYETLREKAVRDQLHKLNLQYVMADEIQLIKNRTAKRSKALYDFNKVPYRVGATATPVKKNAEDIYGIFEFIEPSLFPSWAEFSRNYVRYNRYGRPVGSRNVSRLRSQIMPYIIVKTKEETSEYLPSLFVMQKYVDLEPEQVEMTQKILDDIEKLRDRESQLRTGKTEAQLRNDPELQRVESQIMALQIFAQELANCEELLAQSESQMAKKYITGSSSSKLSLLIDLLEEIIESEEKAAVYSRFERMQDIIAREIGKNKKLQDAKIARLRGSMNHTERYRQIYDLFQDNDDYKILLSTDAGSDSINLSKCRYIIEFDLADSYLTQTQRHGRIERADSAHSTVFVYQLIANDSWDEIQRRIVEKKQNLEDALLR